MQNVAEKLDESTGAFQSHGALLARIEAATEQLEQRIIAAARAAELAAAPPAPVAPAVATPAIPFPQTLAAAPAPAPAPAAAPVVSAPVAAPAPAPAEVAEDVVTDFDQEIASVFTDEAVELLDASQHALAEWNDNRGSVDGLAALKRPLHTIKGGPRMAGLMPM